MNIARGHTYTLVRDGVRLGDGSILPYFDVLGVMEALANPSNLEQFYGNDPMEVREALRVLRRAQNIVRRVSCQAALGRVLGGNSQGKGVGDAGAAVDPRGD